MKLKITIQEGSLSGRVYELEYGHLSIGRDVHCSIKFDSKVENIVSKQHAFIEFKSDGFYITDNNSTNGTHLNGSRIQTSKLSTGDLLEFGKNGIKANVYIEAVKPETELNESLTNNVSLEQNAVNSVEAALINKVLQHKKEQVTLAESVSSLGLGGAEVKPQKSKTGKYVGIGITLFVTVFLGLIVAGIMFMNLGPIAAVVASVIAFFPALIYLFPIVWLDRYDPEPFWLLSLAFAWGALVAVFFSFIINTAALVIGTGIGGQSFGAVMSAVVSAPIFEEITKGAGLLVIVLFFRRYFDGVLDGIIFAGVIALGFATVENVLYYGRAILSGGIQGLMTSFFLRGILSPFIHVTFTAMTGIGFGISRESHNPITKYSAPLIGLIIAIALHAFWNGSAVLFGNGFYLIYLVIEIPFFLVFVSFAFYVMYRQNKIIKEMLAIDVARGLIPQEHFDKATSAFKSTGWVLSSIFNGKYKATSSYIRAIGKLGLSYWHIQRATVAQGQTASFQQNPILREEILKWRDQV